MKTSEFRKLIREEVRKVLSEDAVQSMSAIEAKDYYKTLIGKKIKIDRGRGRSEEVTLMRVQGPYPYKGNVNRKLELYVKDNQGNESIETKVF